MSEFSKSKAFIIGINEYRNLSSLQTAVNDAEKLVRVLEEEHDYEIPSLLLDAKSDEIRALLAKLPELVGENDRILFYFAGHGIASDSEDGLPQGYLLPADAERDDHDKSISMDELHDAFEKIKCRHLLLILDCCFSGAFKWSSGFRGLQLIPKRIYRERYDQYIKDPAWQVITSSASNEEALDLVSSKPLGKHGEIQENGNAHSPFANALFEGLKGGADLIPKDGGDGIITASELYLHLREAVTPQTIELGNGTDDHRQTPSLFPLKKHDRGEYIFLTSEFDHDGLPSFGDMQINPYRGLKSYRYGKQKIRNNGEEIEFEDKDFFYGRDRVIEALEKKIENDSFIVVTGASGTGKSSVVKAGLLPSLKEKGYKILPIKHPGKQSLRALEQLKIPDSQAERKAKLRKHVLLIDQYEELITQCLNESEREKFIKRLKSLLDLEIEDFKLIITIRSDFEPQFDRLILTDRWQDARYVVPSFNTQELREIIVQPAAQRVLHFEPSELVQTIIDEVQQAPGALPLLSFMLSELYELYLNNGRPLSTRALTKEDYENLGGVKGALRTSADAIYDSLDLPHKKTMQKVVLRMVSQEGGELSRKRVFMDELKFTPISGQIFENNYANEKVKNVIDKLLDARLILTGSDRETGKIFVEPAHDALIRGWVRLINWIRTIGDEKIALFAKLNVATSDHLASGKIHDLWHDNYRLDLIEKERAQDDSMLNEAETEFLSKSIKHRRKKNRRFLGGVGVGTFVLLALFLASLMLAIWALNERSVSVEKAREGIANQLVAQAEVSLEKGFRTRAFRLAEFVHRYVQNDNRSARRMLFRTWYHDDLSNSPINWEQATLFGHADKIFSAAYSKDGKLIATGSGDSTAKIWYADSGKLKLTLQHDNIVSTVAFSTDNSNILTGSLDGKAILWNTATGERNYSLNPTNAPVDAVAFSDNGRYFAISNSNATIIFSASSKQRIKTLEQSENVIDIAFSPDGKLLAATTTSEIGIKVWNTNPRLNSQPKVLGGSIGNLLSVAFSPDHKSIATGSVDGKVRFWDRRSLKEIRKSVEPYHKSRIVSIFYSPKGSGLLTGSLDNSAKIIDIPSGKVSRTFIGHTSGILDLAYAQNGKSILTAAADHTAKIWAVHNRQNTISLSRDEVIENDDFSERGDTISQSSSKRSYRLNRKYKSVLLQLNGIRDEDLDRPLAISPDGKMLAVGSRKSDSQDQVATLQDVASANRPIILSGHNGQVVDVAFSDDGKLVATVATDMASKIWDAKTGELLLSLAEKEDGDHLKSNWSAYGVSFSSDGKSVAVEYDEKAIIWFIDSEKILSQVEKTNQKLGFLDIAAIEDHELVDAIEQGMGFDHFIKFARARELAIFGQYFYLEAGKFSEIDQFRNSRHDLALRCLRAAVAKDRAYSNELAAMEMRINPRIEGVE